MQRAIAAAIDDAIAAEQQPRADANRLDRGYDEAVRRRDRLVSAIASETLTQAEAASQLETIRQEIVCLDAARRRACFGAKRAASLALMRDDLLRMASDFRMIACQLSGPALRELIKPWLSGATFEKQSRYLTIRIRRVPSLGLLSSDSPGTR